MSILSVQLSTTSPMDKFDIDASVQAVQGLDRISEIIALHNEIWKYSTGIIDLLKNSSGCYVLIDNAGKLIGYAFIEEDRKRGFTELQDIAVSSWGGAASDASGDEQLSPYQTDSQIG